MSDDPNSMEAPARRRKQKLCDSVADGGAVGANVESGAIFPEFLMDLVARIAQHSTGQLQTVGLTGVHG